MANTLTDLAADIYKAADIVGRELVGVIPSVTVNGGAQEAALNDTVRASFTREATLVTTTPSMTIPEGTDQIVDNKTMTLDTAKSVQIPWTGEDIKHVSNGVGFDTVYGDQIRQAMRALTNQMESDLATTIYKNASRAFGTAGDTPFSSNFNEVAKMRQILVDNGMPTDDRMVSLVMNTNAGANLRNNATLQSADSAGNDQLLRQGTLLDLQGLMMKESAQIKTHTAGTGASATTDAAGYAVGATTITLASAGTGTILAGDVITFAGDTNKYVVTSGNADVSSGGTITIGAPGLRVAIGASATAITVVKDATTLDYTANLAFHRSAVELAVRPMAVPPGGDAATDMMTIQDPRSGLVYQIATYKGYKKSMFEVSALWGYKVWKPEFCATLIG